jgi:hypothetical protein
MGCAAVVHSSAGDEIFTLVHGAQTGPGARPASKSNHWISVAVSHGLKRTGLEVSRSSPSTEVENVAGIPSLHPLRPFFFVVRY